MSRCTFHAEDEREAAALQQALAMVRELKALAGAAPDGKVLAVAEQAAVDFGRRFTRQRLQDVLNAQATDLEKKGGAGGTVPVAGPGATAGGHGVGSSPPRGT
jgi:hypothetical protein